MLELAKSHRFWIAIFALTMIGTLALVGKIDGNTAISSLLGIVGGYGIGVQDAKS
jgi:hypothetical protein